MITGCIFLLLLGGCGESDDGVRVVRVWDENSTDSSSSEEVVRESGITDRVGMVTDVGGIDDASFNQSAWEGLQALEQSWEIQTSYIDSESEADFYDNFAKEAAEGCGLCWGIGFGCADALLQIAQDRPRTHFAIVDSSFENTPDNVTAVVFRAQEPSFLVGYIAAAATHTGKVGFVGGVRGEIIDQFQYGFQAGVDYGAALYGKNVEITIEYADSFGDEQKGYEIAKAMYRSGCDIVYHAAGATGVGVIWAAKDNGKYVIGVDKDQSALAPENILTSAMKKVDIAVERVSESYLRGEAIGGKTISFGLTEGAVGIPEEHKNYRDEIYDSALMIADRIKAGEIVPPKSAEEYEAFRVTLKQ